MIKDKDLRKIFVEAALVNRNYISYRLDLALLKTFISLAAFILVYFLSEDIVLGFLSASLIFVIFTFINKIIVDSKNKKGELLAIDKIKKDYFSSKIEEINSKDFEILVKLLFSNEGYKDMVKKGRSLYLAEKDGYISCIKIFKLYPGIEVEKMDIRSLLTFMCNNNIRQGFLVTTVDLSEEAEKLLETFEDRLDIELITMDHMFDLALKYDILPEESFYYKKLQVERKTMDKREVKDNVLNIKKILIYIPATLFFYLSSRFLPGNTLLIYISYYFLILSIVSVGYYIIYRYMNKAKVEDSK